MASIWLITDRAKKLEGRLAPAKVIGRFNKRIAAMSAANPTAKVTHQDEMLVLFQFPDGTRFALQVEPCSPPSAPEPGQPKRQGNGGVVIDSSGTVHHLGVA